MHTLVIGGTGMLSGVTVWLAEQGHTVSVISRHPERFTMVNIGSDLGRINPIAVDYRESDTLRQRISEAISVFGPIELAILWIHTDAPEAFGIIADEISEHENGSWPLIHVRGSRAYLHPESPPVPPNCLYRQVILGFVAGESGSRWLTHDEISGGVIRAIQTDSERTVVGTFEPWERRPT